MDESRRSQEIRGQAVSAKVDYILLWLKQHLLEIPAGCYIITFIQYDDKPPSPEKLQQAQHQSLTLADLHDRYFNVHGNGTLEENTVAGMQQHFKHWIATLGAGHLIDSLTLADLQGHGRSFWLALQDVSAVESNSRER